MQNRFTRTCVRSGSDGGWWDRYYVYGFGLSRGCQMGFGSGLFRSSEETNLRFKRHSFTWTPCYEGIMLYTTVGPDCRHTSVRFWVCVVLHGSSWTKCGSLKRSFPQVTTRGAFTKFSVCHFLKMLCSHFCVSSCNHCMFNPELIRSRRARLTRLSGLQLLYHLPVLSS